jgi:purine-cytosine permease-like protein
VAGTLELLAYDFFRILRAPLDALYSTTAGFVGLVVLAGFIGALVSRSMGKQRKAVREAVYAVCVLGGMVLAVLHYQGKLPL